MPAGATRSGHFNDSDVAEVAKLALHRFQQSASQMRGALLPSTFLSIVTLGVTYSYRVQAFQLIKCLILLVGAPGLEPGTR
jgi:hypothetical protein